MINMLQVSEEQLAALFGNCGKVISSKYTQINEIYSFIVTNVRELMWPCDIIYFHH